MSPTGKLLTRFCHVIGLIMILVITVLTLSPANSPLVAISLWDKFMHFAGYSALAAWYVLLVPKAHYLKLLTALVALGVSLELAQSVVPGRHTDGLDALANALGAAAGVALGWTPWRHTLPYINRMLFGQSSR